VLQEQTWNAKTNGEAFDMNLYVERVKTAVQTALELPEFIRKIALKGRN
jgi:hypothetical protein